MQPSANNTSPEDESGKSRLDREIEEILAKNDTIRHLPPPPKAPAQRPRSTTARQSLDDIIPPRVMKLLSTPIILALAFGLLAYLVRGFSPLLANLASFFAVACILLPMVQRFRGPSGRAPGETRMWRGQVVDMRPRNRSPFDGLRDWWDSRRR
jgi:hypothetical protein